MVNSKINMNQTWKDTNFKEYYEWIKINCVGKVVEYDQPDYNTEVFFENIKEFTSDWEPKKREEQIYFSKPLSNRLAVRHNQDRRKHSGEEIRRTHQRAGPLPDWIFRFQKTIINTAPSHEIGIPLSGYLTNMTTGMLFLELTTVHLLNS